MKLRELKVNPHVNLRPENYNSLFLNVTAESGTKELSRFEIIKLRNYLNDFINNNLEEEENE